MSELIPSEKIKERILIVRGQKVMLDKDLAELYGVGTRDLNKAVTRNLERFPADFMFQMTKEEFDRLMFHSGTSKRGGTRKPARVFTEQGVAMLSSVLNSERAIQVNILRHKSWRIRHDFWQKIMRTFTKLRKLMITHENLRCKIEKMEKKYDYQFKAVFEAIKKLIDSPQKTKRPIGFRPK